MDKLMLLDFDGVINAASSLVLPSDRIHGSPTQHPDLTSVSVKLQGDDGSAIPFTVNVSPTVIRELFHVVRLIEGRWFSEWFASTQTFPQALDMPSMPFEGNERLIVDTDQEWWKLSFLRTHHLDREIIWVDDSLNSKPGVMEWVAEQKGRVQTIIPNSRTGLSTDDLKKLVELAS
jgi:hypothetical protein